MKFVNDILDEPIQNQLLKRLSVILIPLGFLGSLISLTGSLFGEQSTHQLMVSLCVLCLFSVSLFFLRRQEIKRAVLMIILGMWLIFSVMTLQGTGVMGPDYPSLIFPIVAVSTVSSSSGLLVASYLSFVLVGALSFLPPLSSIALVSLSLAPRGCGGSTPCMALGSPSCCTSRSALMGRSSKKSPRERAS